MPDALDDLMAKLKQEPLDKPLDGVAADVEARLHSQASMQAQMWSVRAAAVLMVAIGGFLVSASLEGARDTRQQTPFSDWSSLAPSTLLESGG
ncbi:MAG: hypothetical protein R3C46_05565 [Hyphomonadaceae bacterium]